MQLEHDTGTPYTGAAVFLLSITWVWCSLLKGLFKHLNVQSLIRQESKASAQDRPTRSLPSISHSWGDTSMGFLNLALNVAHGPSSAILSVCLSVCPVCPVYSTNGFCPHFRQSLLHCLSCVSCVCRIPTTIWPICCHGCFVDV